MTTINDLRNAVKAKMCKVCSYAGWIDRSYCSDSYGALVDDAGVRVGFCSDASDAKWLYGITSNDSESTTDCASFEAACCLSPGVDF